MNRRRFPRAIDPARVGKYPASCYGGGGLVWDAVLEYRVWCHPERGAPDRANGSDYYYAFASYPDALRFSKKHPCTEEANIGMAGGVSLSSAPHEEHHSRFPVAQCPQESIGHSAGLGTKADGWLAFCAAKPGPQSRAMIFTPGCLVTESWAFRAGE